jgi:hypothetical protein
MQKVSYISPSVPLREYIGRRTLDDNVILRVREIAESQVPPTAPDYRLVFVIPDHVWRWANQCPLSQDESKEHLQSGMTEARIRHLLAVTLLDYMRPTDVANILGVVPSVITRAKKLSQQPLDTAMPTRNELIRMFYIGKTMEQIAALYSVPVSTMRTYAAKMDGGIKAIRAEARKLLDERAITSIEGMRHEQSQRRARVANIAESGGDISKSTKARTKKTGRTPGVHKPRTRAVSS